MRSTLRHLPFLLVPAFAVLATPGPARAQEAAPLEAIVEEIAPPETVEAEPTGEDAATDVEDAASSPNPLAAFRIENFGATLSAPLFTPSRMPPVIPEEPVEPEMVAALPEEPVEADPTPPPFKLVGVVSSDSQQVAFLLDESTGEIQHLASGDDYDGWTMEIVDERTVEFQNEDLSHRLAMFEEFEAPYGDEYNEEWDESYEDEDYQEPALPRGGGQLTYDRPVGKEEIDPNTGYPIDPDTGYATDPDTGQQYDPETGYEIDANTGLPMDPDTGQPFDPETGQYYDPNTGLPVDDS